MNRLTLGLAGLATLTAACVTEHVDDGIDTELLAEYRRAVPSQAQLAAPAPEASTAEALGDPAFYPYASAEIVFGINGTVGMTLALLDVIVSTPPSFYDSSKKEFVWGPYADDVGYVAAWVRDTDGAGDFEYEFAMLRGASNDLATLTPVIWGGGTPDPVDDDHGVGVALWDMTANRAFLEANDPSYDPAQHDSGRFAALFGAGPAEDDPASEVSFVVAVFRDYVEKGSSEAPNDLDYLYGRHVSPEATIDFIDYETEFDVSIPADGVRERVGVRMAFLDQGTGRAEADAIEGSLPPGDRYDVVECWDTSLSETYLRAEHMSGGDVMDSYETGDAADCGLFTPTLDALEVPSLQDVDPALLAILDEVATTGAPPSE